MSTIINAKPHAQDGTITIISRINQASLNKELLLIKKRASPDDNLSIKEYAPNTNAPFDPLIPTTSLIRLIAVLSKSAYETPIITATTYTSHLKLVCIKAKDAPEVAANMHPII